MKNKLLAVVMSLCIAAAPTAGTFATAADVATTQIAAEESAEAGNVTEESDEDMLEPEQSEKPAVVEEGQESLDEESINEESPSEQDEIKGPEESSDAANESSNGTADTRDEGLVDEGAARDNESENISESEHEDAENTVEEISEEEPNETLEKTAENAEDSEEEVAEVIEEIDELEAAKSAMTQMIESSAESHDENSSAAAVTVSAEENIDKLIEYVMKNGTYSNGIYTLKTPELTTTSGNVKIKFYPAVIVNLSSGFVRLKFYSSFTNSSIKTMDYEMEYNIQKKTFGSLYCTCSFTSVLFLVSKADINLKTYLPDQDLNFKFVTGIGFTSEADAELIDQFSGIFKDIALMSLNSFLVLEPKLCLYALGFNKFIPFDEVDYYMPSTSFTHTGKEIIPPVEVSYTGFVLEEGVHYELDYHDNTDVGYGTVTVNATGRLSGSKELIYAILPTASKKVTIYNVAQGIKVTWLPVEGATRYKVYRDGELIKTTSVLEITDGDVKYRSGEKFTYKVVATAKSVGDSLVARTGTYYRLMPVGIKTVTNSGAGKMTVTYDKSAGSSGYVVRYGLKSDMNDAKVITVKGEDTLSRTFSNLTKGKTYYVQVRTYKIDNGIRYYSGYCTTKTVKIVK